MADRGESDKCIGSSRLALAFVVSFGFFSMAAVRATISIAIVCMVNHTAVKQLSEGHWIVYDEDTVKCSSNLSFGHKSNYQEGSFIWLKETQGLILSSIYWGNVVTSLPAGMIASKYGGRNQMGSVVTQMVSGILCAYLGWPSIFYIFGGISCVCCICWFIIAYDSPEEHPRMSAAEKKYIQDSLAGQMEKKNELVSLQYRWL
ncbi:sodium-dependent phosphate transport protein 3-like [Tubulanus polymorphus]|uniref:sodium-dependent phosphate transport protein 3-like n=1 Tax=Tubulanus polymorphus TaxID=672921 RepID=UPI003DA2C83C